jgi:uncharacterized protein with beta-barrel porin domain
MHFENSAMADPTIQASNTEDRLRSAARLSLAVLLATTALGVVSARAVDGTWVGGNGGDPNEWVEPNNWTGAAVPNGIATFTNTGVTTVANDNGIVIIGELLFTAAPNAQAYTININNPFIINALGIVNNSTNPQTFNVSSGNSLVFQNGSTASGGTGLVTINNVGAGFINFQNTSTAGSATIVNGGILQFADTSTAASANITNTGETDFFNATSAGSATITNTGTLTFNNTATAGTAHIANNSGSLQFNNSSTAGNAIITTANGTGITFNNTSTAGNSNITNVNGALLGFFNSSSAGTAVIANNAGGSMAFNDTSTAGSAGITNSGGLAFNNSSTGGSSNLTNNAAATIGFNDTSTGGAATITNAGTVSFNTSATAGSAHIIDNGGSFLNFNNSSTAGNAVIVNNALGTTQFLDTSTAGNATINNAVNGITQFFTNSTAGNATINNNGGLTQFNNSSTAGNAVITTSSTGAVFFVGTSSGGQATFVTNTGGVFDMSGLASTGMTAGSIAGAGNYFLGSKSLTVGGNNLSTTVSGVISDGGLSGGVGGSLTKVGTGTLNLTGVNTYAGPTNVNGGILSVNGSIATSSLTVNAGGTLGGNGIVGNTTVNGGTLAPGNSIGLLTVQGNLVFTTAATYMVEVSPSNADRVNVTGTATLGGATVNAVFQPGSYVNRQYTIVNATGGVSGTFNPAVVSNMANIQSTLSYDANDAFLNIKLAFAPPPSGALSVNQQNVANAITNFFNATGSIPAAFAGLNAAGLTIASGELGTGVIQSSIKADDLFLNLLLDPMVAGRAGGFAAPGGGASQFADDDASLAYAAKRKASAGEREAYAMATKAPPLAAQPINRWSVWGASYGGSETVGGNSIVGSQDTRASVYGLVAGADYKVTPDTLVGFALAGGQTGFSLANGLGSGSADVFQAGAFARQNLGPAYLSAALAYGWHDVTTNRTVALAGTDLLQGRFRADTFSGRFEGGYRFATPFVAITPYGAAQVISFNLPSYAEQTLAGTGMFALNYAAQTTTDTRTELGLRSDKSFAMQDAMMTLRGRAAWAHDYNPDRAVTALFQTLPGASFVVNGARPDADSALVSAGAEMKWLNGFSLAATFEGEFSGNVTSYAGKGVARYTW